MAETGQSACRKNGVRCLGVLQMSFTHGRPEADDSVLLKKKLKEPARYRVLLHNDDYTTMEFVVSILRRIFHKTPDEAMTIMMAVHQSGIGECGVYTYEIAEAKVKHVHKEARASDFPLKCSMEKI